MICPTDLSLVQGLVLVLRIIVAEPDGGKVNHLLEGKLDCNHRQISISYTGPTPLGMEGDWIRVRWSGSCSLLRTVTEDPYLGPKGHRAWLCTADTVEL